ncbi:Vascular endothelial zinc finger 1 [Nymphon striatum]|nr:Vascular endothelial zinc finger 1 [Nymphon striatum]
MHGIGCRQFAQSNIKVGCLVPLVQTLDEDKSPTELSLPSYNRLFNLTQSEDKQYKCPQCNKMFSKRYNMTKHLAHFHAPVHIRHHCNICLNKSFRWKEDLNKHMDKIHGRRKRFKCSYCDKFFHYHWRMQQHFYNSHPAINCDIDSNMNTLMDNDSNNDNDDKE